MSDLVYFTMSTKTPKVTDPKINRRSELDQDQLYAIVDNISEGVFLTDVNGQLTFMNQKALAELGEHALNTHVLDIFKELNARNISNTQKVSNTELPPIVSLKEGTKNKLECLVDTPKGLDRSIKLVSSPLKDKKGIITGSLTTCRDITKTKGSERKLRESEQMYLSLIDRINEGLILMDLSGNVQFANDRFCKMLGKDLKEVEGSDYFQFVDVKNSSKEEYQKKKANILSGTSGRLMLQLKHNDGSRIAVDISTSPLKDLNDKLIGAMCIHSDVTERETMLQDLKASETRYRTLMERMNEGLIMVDNKNRITYVNDLFCKSLGYQKDELIGHVAYKVIKTSEISASDFRAKSKDRLKGISENYEINLFTQKGESRWYQVSASPVYDHKERVIGSMGMHTDITEQKKITAENERLLAVIGSTTDLLMVTDYYGRPFYLNQAVRDKLGIRKSQNMQELCMSDFYTPESKLKFEQEIVPYLLEHDTWQGELYIRNKKGETVPVSQVLLSKKNEKGKIEYFASIIRDISEQKRTQRELAILARMPDENPAPVLRVSVDGTVVYANAASEILLKSWKTKVGKKLPDVWQRTIKKVSSSGHFKEFEADFGRKVFDLKIVPIAEYDYVNIIASDITHRKKAEKQLLASENKYRAIVEDQTELITRFLADGTLTFANKAYCRYYGHDPKKVIGKNLFDIIPQSSRDDLIQGLSTLTPDDPVVTYNVFFDDPVNPRWQLWTDRAIYDDNGLFIEYQSVGQDITTLKKAEQELRKQEVYLRQIIDSLPNIVYVKGADGKYLLVNRAFSDLMNKDIKDLVGKTDKDLFGDTTLSKEYTDTDKNVLDNNSTYVNSEDKQIDQRSGETRWFHTVKTPMVSGRKQKREVLGVSTDITQRMQIEQTLKFQLKLKELTSKISSKFINLSYSDIDEGITKALGLIGEFNQVDRAVISLLGEKYSETSTYTWFKDPNDQLTSNLKNLFTDSLAYPEGVEELKKRGYLNIPEIQELPDSAKELKKHSKEVKNRSLLFIPLEFKNELMGFMSLSSRTPRKKWSNDTIAMLQIIGQTFSSALERKTTEALLNFTLEFENIITTISANFINIQPDEINSEIDTALRYVSQFLGVDHGSVFLNKGDDKHLQLTNVWIQKPDAIKKKYLQNIETTEHNWVYEQMQSFGVLSVPDVNQLPPVAKDLKVLMKTTGTRAAVGVPIIYRGDFTGVLLFGSFSKEAFWPEEAIPLMKILGQIIANALDRMRTEEHLSETREMYRTLARNIPKAAVMMFDKDLRYRLVEGAELEEQGFFKEDMEGKTLREVLPKSSVKELEPLYRKALAGEQLMFERSYNNKHYLIHILPVRNEHEEVSAGMVMSLDISDLKNIQSQLEEQATELKRSNEDLELFAYAASHDLQEPLRMVSSYVHLIQRRLGEVTPEVAEFMNFAVDGVKRMQEVINDLLEYSRVDRKGSPFQMVDLNKVLQLVEINLQNVIRSTNAKIVLEKPLPKAVVDQSQFISLFQNLIENSIKFKSKEPPLIQISYEDHPDRWVFQVKDNGIGIEKKFFERIFIIFQRLNSRTEYEGTGIGLAICKKIVERHMGNIWLGSEPEKGTTFYFEFPKNLK